MGAWKHGSMGAWKHGSIGGWERGVMSLECGDLAIVDFAIRECENLHSPFTPDGYRDYDSEFIITFTIRKSDPQIRLKLKIFIDECISQ